MKILLDENIDVRFKNSFNNSPHQVFTVREMKWNGTKNGALLSLLKEYNFDCWIVVDKNIPYQQNIQNLPCVIIVLDVLRNTLKHLAPLAPKIVVALEGVGDNKLIIISE